VTKRQVSGGTHSDIGRDCRDAFLGLAKTCRKLGSSPDLTQCRPGFCSDYFCIRHVTDFADVFEGVSPTLKGRVNPPTPPACLFRVACGVDRALNMPPAWRTRSVMPSRP
jgi:hypothetical protein